jgi:hypothetical protein
MCITLLHITSYNNYSTSHISFSTYSILLRTFGINVNNVLNHTRELDIIAFLKRNFLFFGTRVGCRLCFCLSGFELKELSRQQGALTT